MRGCDPICCGPGGTAPTHSTAPDPTVITAQTEPFPQIKPTVKHSQKAPVGRQPHTAPQPHAALIPQDRTDPTAQCSADTRHSPTSSARPPSPPNRGHHSAGSSGRTDAERQQSPGQPRPHSAVLLHRCFWGWQLHALPKITALRAALRAPHAQHTDMGWWHRAGVTTSRT